ARASRPPPSQVHACTSSHRPTATNSLLTIQLQPTPGDVAALAEKWSGDEMSVTEEAWRGGTGRGNFLR
ncbi:hypothetical protein Zm00014a_016567, partial [Zea mays]